MLVAFPPHRFKHPRSPEDLSWAWIIVLSQERKVAEIDPLSRFPRDRYRCTFVKGLYQMLEKFHACYLFQIWVEKRYQQPSLHAETNRSRKHRQLQNHSPTLINHLLDLLFLPFFCRLSLPRSKGFRRQQSIIMLSYFTSPKCLYSICQTRFYCSSSHSLRFPKSCMPAPSLPPIRFEYLSGENLIRTDSEHLGYQC